MINVAKETLLSRQACWRTLNTHSIFIHHLKLIINIKYYSDNFDNKFRVFL